MDDPDEFTTEDLQCQVLQNSKGQHQLTLAELHRVNDDEIVRPVVHGEEVETLGQAFPLTGQTRQIELSRTVLTGPGKPPVRVAITLEFASSIPEFEESAWYLASGRMTYRDGRSGATVPVLEVGDFVPAPPPSEPLVD